MDWTECIKSRTVKDVSEDKNRIQSIREIALLKIKSANFLPEDHIISKISLLYDALRELLEAKALENGYKIYNHECYIAFLKEILNKSKEGYLFDNLRKIRNGINYYGKTVDSEDAEKIIIDLKKLIQEFLQ
ncbi:MAG: hypothetical protein K0B02_04460 [DPANN group archaeon]|nr:hypothetical protein [DPANN group archaeon]